MLLHLLMGVGGLLSSWLHRTELHRAQAISHSHVPVISRPGLLGPPGGAQAFEVELGATGCSTLVYRESCLVLANGLLFLTIW